MSFLTTLRASSRLPLRQTPVPALTSAFHTSAARAGLKEGDQSRDDLHNVYEEEKQNQVKSHKEGSAKWNQNLASNSEASVKADREEINDKESFRDLQDRTKNEAGKK
ncbi:hypothetical protein BJY04DRAFT_220741 [Aspergillus karnatakaensis]|uniref:uncharacterized protein n=1 Tax=Aspergillus karnatakaensis TaxID=1810916 RepID=UPI003CCCAAE3